jgi:peptidoglycan/LPS O-acetylase OafA/YrhL
MYATTRVSPANERKRRHSVALDILRGLAAVTVLFVHVRGASFVEFGALPPEQKTSLVAVLFGLTRLGQEAVLVFFVLSGFLVGGQIIDRSRKGNFDLATYAIDRCTRIFFPLIPACLLTAIVSSVFFGQRVSIVQLAANMSGMNGIVAPTLDHNPPLWSLSYEIWFYICGGTLGYLGVSGTSVGALVVMALSTVIFSMIGHPEFLLYWAFGALMTLFLLAHFRSWLFLAGIALAFFGAAFHELAFPSKSFANVTLVPIEASRAFLCIGMSLSLPFLCSRRVDALLDFIRKPARALSAVSYTLYLVHYPINSALDRFFPKAAVITFESSAIFGVRIALCSAAAAGMYFLFERNTPILRSWLSARRKGWQKIKTVPARNHD